ncbi:hypothetical protein, partial [Alteromonas sp.]|uniref:hypothetical protein n=1 Tax=Alteromonas sp. TaxID=232 RepID=UPI00257A0E4B
NSEVKRISADGSVGFPHVRVGHCQVPLRKTRLTAGFLLSAPKIMGVRSASKNKWGAGPHLSLNYIQHIRPSEHKTGAEPNILSSPPYNSGYQTQK